MTEFIFAVIFLALAGLAVVMQKTYFYLPTKELKRQAANHEPLAEVLWRAVAYGSALRILLWVVTVFGLGMGLVLLSHVIPTIVAVVAVALVVMYIFGWVPNTRLTSIGGRATVMATPIVVWLLEHSKLVLDLLQRFARKHVIRGHTGLFEREDLIDFLEAQKKQKDNRISMEDLSMAQASLLFSTKLVRDVLTPRRVVVAAKDSDDIGPVLMDTLHKSGHSRFPVHGDGETIVGILYLRDLIRAKASGKVQAHMHKQVCYIHEDQTLSEALQAILKTHQQLFVVVNSFEEYVGIISIEDILEAIIGEHIVDEFDQYEDLRAVAARMAAKDHHHHEKEQKTTEKQAAAETKDEKVDEPAKKSK